MSIGSKFVYLWLHAASCYRWTQRLAKFALNALHRRDEDPVRSSDLWDLTHPVFVNSEEQHTDDGSDEREDGDDDDYGYYEEDNDYDGASVESGSHFKV